MGRYRDAPDRQFLLIALWGNATHRLMNGVIFSRNIPLSPAIQVLSTLIRVNA